MTNHQLIHVLPSQVANQIAAGEVVERPASVVKELVENSMDAGATIITVRIEGAGKKRIEIEDDGCGMSAVDAEMALRRHATSKIQSAEDLHHIASHGFRGEALPSVASVSRFRLHTALTGEHEGVEVRVDGGGETQVLPASPRKGTRIEVLDLFLNTPARLRFMRTDKTEEAAIVDVFRALAMTSPSVNMRLIFDGRKRFDLHAQDEAARIMALMGDDFADNAIPQKIEYHGMQLSGYFGLPTFHHRGATRMFFIVNGRVIRDKSLIAAMRAGYRDVMFHDRYPVAVLRLEMDPADVDVNVHPAKREVRFKSSQQVHAGVVSCVRAAIDSMGHQVSSTTTGQALNAMSSNSSATVGATPAPGFSSGMPAFKSQQFRSQGGSQRSVAPMPQASSGGYQGASPDIQRILFSAPQAHEPSSNYQVSDRLDLGRPVCQIHRCYILSQTDDGVTLIDQHAAHERMTYEKLKAQLTEGRIPRQMLLTPETLSLESEEIAWLLDHREELDAFGVEVKAIDEQAENCAIHSVPAMLSDESPAELVAELIASCMLLGAEAEGDRSGLGRVLERWLGNRACKGSIKAGRILNSDEQDRLLREMEQTPNIAQCNHGRPTYVRLSLNDLDRLFGRKE